MQPPYSQSASSTSRLARTAWAVLVVLGGCSGLFGVWLTLEITRVGLDAPIGRQSDAPLPARAVALVTPVAGSPVPAVLADRYLAAWTAGEYETMYDLLAPTARASIDEAAFRHRYEAISDEAMILALHAARDASIPPNDPDQPFTLSIETARAGRYEERNTLPFVLHDGFWGVDWRPSSILHQLSAGDRVHLESDEPIRGRILDRHGRVLARQIEIATIGVVPVDLEDTDTTITRLSTALSVDVMTIRQRIAAGQDDWFVPIARRDWSAPTLAERQLLDLPGVVARVGYERTYPLGSVAAHVVGYVRPVTDAEAADVRARGLRPFDWIGAAGAEASHEHVLAGRPGGRLTIVRADGTTRAVLAERQAVPGRDVYLTLELPLQQAAEAALGDRSGALITLDVDSGAIRALASRPTFDPNLFVRDPEAAMRYLADPKRPLLNRAIGRAYPPGQPFVLVTAAAALEAKLVSMNDEVDCPAAMHVVGRTEVWRNLRPNIVGMVPIKQALADGCTTAFLAMAERLHGRDAMLLPTMARALGFGVPAGAVGHDEAPGQLPDATAEGWSVEVSIGAAAGQGGVQATSLQVARAYAAAASDGRPGTPHVVDHVAGEIAVAGDLGTQGMLNNVSGDTRTALRSIVLAPMRRMGLASAAATRQDQVGATLHVAGAGPTSTPGVVDSWHVVLSVTPTPTVLVVVLEGSVDGEATPIAQRLIESGWRSDTYP